MTNPTPAPDDGQRKVARELYRAMETTRWYPDPYQRDDDIELIAFALAAARRDGMVRACACVCRYCKLGSKAQPNKKKTGIHAFVHVLLNEVVVCEAASIRAEMERE